MSDDAIADLASAVADGEAIDWQTARSRLATPQQQSIAEELRALSRLGGTHSLRRPAGGSHGCHGASRRSGFWPSSRRVLGLRATWSPWRFLVAGRILVLFGMCIVFALAGLMLTAGNRIRRARALGGAYWAISASFGAFGLLDGFGQIWPDMWMLAVFISMRPEAFFGAFLWDFAREFPRITRFSRLDARLSSGAERVNGGGRGVVRRQRHPGRLTRVHPSRWAAPAQRMTKFAAAVLEPGFACALPASSSRVGVRRDQAVSDEGRRARSFACVHGAGARSG